MAYNSSYTGAQIDAAVGAVKEKESTWDTAASTAQSAAQAASTAQSTAEKAQTAASDAATAAENAQKTADSKAPMYTYGTDDMTAGSSALESGKLYFVYE